MLNDAAWPMRGLSFALGAPVGLMLGPLVLLVAQGARQDPEAVAVAPLLMLAGSPLFVLVGVVTVVLLGRADRRLRQRAWRPHGDPSRVTAYGVPAAGRVVRTRRDGRLGHAVVCAALAPAGARRVLAMTHHTGLRAGQPVALLLDPDDHDVAVLDDRVGPGDLAAVDADPRWRTWVLPTEGRVAGGWSWVALAAAVGVLVGGGVSLGVLALVT